MRRILASASPRRRELLEMLWGDGLEIIPALGEERADPRLTPREQVRELALGKAREVWERVGDPDALVIGADTLVVLDGVVMGKPRTPVEAVDMLSRLSGRRHLVYTGVAVLRGGVVRCHVEETAVFFRPLGLEEIQRYVDTGEPMDKAGAYGVQGRGSLFVERLEGDFFNVMGLPLCALGRMLDAMGLEA